MDIQGKSKLFDKFYRLSGGSPLYAAEIIRLVGRGQGSLDQCLEKFKGADGEDVRKFSFERELNALSDSQMRIVYGLSILEIASFIELLDVTGSSDKLLADDLDVLRQYHLVSLPTAATAAGQIYEAEGSIVLLRELVAGKISSGRRRIESHCQRLRNAAGNRNANVGLAISRVVALWEQGRANDALDVAGVEAQSRGNKHPDLQCILGRAFLRAEPPQAAAADAALRSAFQLGCARHELFDLWIEAKRARSDWQGVIDTAQLALRQRPSVKYVVERAAAHFALGEQARGDLNLRDALSHFERCGAMLDKAIARGSMGGYFEEAKQLRKSAYLEAIAAAKEEYRTPGSMLEIWLICVEAFRAFVRTRSVIFDGVESLYAWGVHVMDFRDHIHESSLSKLEGALDELVKIEAVLHEKSWDDAASVQRVRDSIVRVRRLVDRGREELRAAKP